MAVVCWSWDAAAPEGRAPAHVPHTPSHFSRSPCWRDALAQGGRVAAAVDAAWHWEWCQRAGGPLCGCQPAPRCRLQASLQVGQGVAPPPGRFVPSSQRGQGCLVPASGHWPYLLLLCYLCGLVLGFLPGGEAAILGCHLSRPLSTRLSRF